jgi:hypothetical protein
MHVSGPPTQPVLPNQWSILHAGVRASGGHGLASISTAEPARIDRAFPTLTRALRGNAKDCAGVQSGDGGFNAKGDKLACRQ